MQRRQLFGLLLVVVVIGIVLRFWGLGTHSFWNDELSSWYRSHYNSITTVLQNAQHDMHPPGHHVVMYWVEQFVGDSEFALRFPSAIFGVFAIVLMMLLGFRLYSYKEGLIAGLFITVFWFPI